MQVTQKSNESTPNSERRLDDTAKENNLKCFHGFKVDPASPDFTYLEKIGSGKYGVVYRAKCRICDFDIAVKEVEAHPENSACTGLELRNLMHLKKYSHPNIIVFFGNIDQHPKRLLFLEIGNVSLNKFLDEKHCKLSISQFHDIIFQLFSMLIYLDKVQLYHGDFYHKNMVVFLPEGTIKLIDFGISKLPQDSDYKSPLADLEVASFDLAQLQLTMRYKSEDKNYDSANKLFCQYKYRELLIESGREVQSTAETLLFNNDNWLPELPHETRELIVKGFSHDIQEQREVLTTSQHIVPRERLSIL